jgi:hypothetical protein
MPTDTELLPIFEFVPIATESTLMIIAGLPACAIKIDPFAPENLTLDVPFDMNELDPDAGGA